MDRHHEPHSAATPNPLESNDPSKRRFPWEICILIGIEVLLFFCNYFPGTYLMGWDNMMPELNIRANLTRAITSTWLEYRGLGLFDGMSHAATLIHTLFVGGLSLLIPQSMVRYTMIFLFHILGGFGMFLFLRTLLREVLVFFQHRQKLPSTPWLLPFLTLSGTLFYLFNIATIQIFAVPLESFSIHFAVLPWMSWIVIHILLNPTKKNTLLFSIIVLLASAQYFIPTLFIASSLIIVVFLFWGVFLPNTIHSTTKRIRISVFMAVSYVLLNAYWLVPWVAGLPLNAPVIADAKINQMSSSEVFSLNKSYGNVWDVLRLRGWVFTQTELNTSGNAEYIVRAWKELYESPIGGIISTVIILFLCIGVATAVEISVKRHHPPLRLMTISLLTLLGIGLFFLGNNIPGITFITGRLRDTFPLFAEAYRFPFTKFILLFSFAYTAFITLGFFRLLFALRTQKVLRYIVSFAIGLGLLMLTLPAWTGQFFFSAMRVPLPDAYTQLFQYMKTQDPNGRVAVLPQTEFWSWKNYVWGYRGSGFLWFGLQQPLLDRAFDPWSHENESYYWELSQAIYSKDAQQLLNILQKYDIRFVLLDGYQRTTAGNNHSLFIEEAIRLFETIPELQKNVTFENLTVYERQGLISNTFVSFIQDAPRVWPNQLWHDIDPAFSAVGSYVTDSTRGNDIQFPFSTLFTKRSIGSERFSVIADGATIQLSTPFLSSFSQIEKVAPLPATTSLRRTDGQFIAEISKFDSLRFQATTENFLTPDLISSCSPNTQGTTEGQILNEDGTFIRVQTSGESGCLKFGKAEVSHQLGYVVEIKSRHVSGRPLQLGIINETAKHNTVDLYLPIDTAWKTSYVILPSLGDDGLGYSFILTNKEVRGEVTENDIASITFYEIPYDEIVNAYISGDGSLPKRSTQSVPVTVSHPNAVYYSTQLAGVKPGMNIALYQSFHPLWLAYIVPCNNTTISCRLKQGLPFLFGTKLDSHKRLNAWANAWAVPSDIDDDVSSDINAPVIIFFFLPQLLQWIGFAVLPLPFFYVFFLRLRRKK